MKVGEDVLVAGATVGESVSGDDPPPTFSPLSAAVGSNVSTRIGADDGAVVSSSGSAGKFVMFVTLMDAEPPITSVTLVPVTFL